VHDLIAAMIKQGWRWTEEFIWHKKNAFPGYWKHRLRDAWESCHQFNKQKDFNMYQEEVKIPIGAWSKSLNPNKVRKDRRDRPNNFFGTNDANWIGKETVLPSNVHLSTVCSNTGHSAPFPIALPEFFIKLFSKEQDTILDPFLGSGTTLLAALSLNRIGIGIEINPEYISLAQQRLEHL